MHTNMKTLVAPPHAIAVHKANVWFNATKVYSYNVLSINGINAMVFRFVTLSTYICIAQIHQILVNRLTTAWMSNARVRCGVRIQCTVGVAALAPLSINYSDKARVPCWCEITFSVQDLSRNIMSVYDDSKL